MTKYTKDELNAEIEATIYPNSSGEISAQDHQDMLKDVNDSVMNEKEPKAQADLDMQGNNILNAGNVGSGDVVGPASSVDTHIASFDGTTGKLIQDTGIPEIRVMRMSSDNISANKIPVSTGVNQFGASRINEEITQTPGGGPHGSTRYIFTGIADNAFPPVYEEMDFEVLFQQDNQFGDTSSLRFSTFRGGFENAELEMKENGDTVFFTSSDWTQVLNEIRLYSLNDSGRVSLVRPDVLTTSYDIKLPPNPPAVNQILESDASGNLSWINTPSGGGGGLVSEMVQMEGLTGDPGAFGLLNFNTTIRDTINTLGSYVNTGTGFTFTASKEISIVCSVSLASPSLVGSQATFLFTYTPNGGGAEQRLQSANIGDAQASEEARTNGTWTSIMQAGDTLQFTNAGFNAIQTNTTAQLSLVATGVGSVLLATESVGGSPVIEQVQAFEFSFSPNALDYFDFNTSGNYINTISKLGSTTISDGVNRFTYTANQRVKVDIHVKAPVTAITGAIGVFAFDVNNVTYQRAEASNYGSNGDVVVSSSWSGIMESGQLLRILAMQNPSNSWIINSTSASVSMTVMAVS